MMVKEYKITKKVMKLGKKVGIDMTHITTLEQLKELLECLGVMDVTLPEDISYTITCCKVECGFLAGKAHVVAMQVVLLELAYLVYEHKKTGQFDDSRLKKVLQDLLWRNSYYEEYI